MWHFYRGYLYSILIVYICGMLSMKSLKPTDPEVRCKHNEIDREEEREN